MAITAHLLDIAQRCIRTVEINAGIPLQSIYRHVGCDLVDVVRIDENHVIFVDDDGMRVF